MIIGKFVKDILTEDDAGSVFCFVRVLSIVAGFVLLGLLVYQTAMDYRLFDIAKAGEGLLAYLAGVGGAIWGKTKSGA